jgi:hypothetical protein
MISQHARKKILLCNLINCFNCLCPSGKRPAPRSAEGGKNYKNKNCFNLTIRKFADIDTKITPFFIKYPILGNKSLDFHDFCKVANLIKEKNIFK